MGLNNLLYQIQAQARAAHLILEGAPAGSFDTIYEFFGAQLNVATAAPGDAGYNGGRWIVQGLDWNSSYADAVAQHGGTNGVIDTNAEIDAVLADPDAGGATTFEVKRFECPVIKNV